MNRFKLNVQTNASCVDILVWAAREENGMHYMQELKIRLRWIRNMSASCTRIPNLLDPEHVSFLYPDPNPLDPEHVSFLDPDPNPLDPEHVSFLDPDLNRLDPEHVSFLYPDPNPLDPENVSFLDPDPNPLDLEHVSFLYPDPNPLDPEYVSFLYLDPNPLDPEHVSFWTRVLKNFKYLDQRIRIQWAKYLPKPAKKLNVLKAKSQLSTSERLLKKNEIC